MMTMMKITTTTMTTVTIHIVAKNTHTNNGHGPFEQHYSDTTNNTTIIEDFQPEWCISTIHHA